MSKTQEYQRLENEMTLIFHHVTGGFLEERNQGSSVGDRGSGIGDRGLILTYSNNKNDGDDYDNNTNNNNKTNKEIDWNDKWIVINVAVPYVFKGNLF